MRGMEGFIAEPRRHAGDVCATHELEDGVEAGVVVAARSPLVAHRQAIHAQWHLATSPHPRSWMVSPAVSEAEQRLEQLNYFEALLTEALTIQATCRCCEIAAW